MAAALPISDFSRFATWREQGYAGEMRYLTDQRGDLRADPRSLLPEAQSIVCVGKLYNSGATGTDKKAEGRIARYAGQSDYHEVMHTSLRTLAARIEAEHAEPLAWRACVDTAPLLERSYAQAAGLGWIGRNTCLINQERGSWFFLGELLLSIPLSVDAPPPNRCGTCRRCIDACPTEAIVADGRGGWTLDSRSCISYLTIEKRGAPEVSDARTGNHIFGCDICQDVCPWNSKAPVSDDAAYAAVKFSRDLVLLAGMTEQEFRQTFQASPVWRAKYEGFLRNVALAIGNSGDVHLLDVLKKLELHPNTVVAAAASLAALRLETDAISDVDALPREIH